MPTGKAEHEHASEAKCPATWANALPRARQKPVGHLEPGILSVIKTCGQRYPAADDEQYLNNITWCYSAACTKHARCKSCASSVIAGVMRLGVCCKRFPPSASASELIKEQLVDNLQPHQSW